MDSVWLISLAFALIPVKTKPAHGQVADVLPLDQRANLTFCHRHRGTFTEKSSHRRINRSLRLFLSRRSFTSAYKQVTDGEDTTEFFYNLMGDKITYEERTGAGAGELN